MLGICHSGRGVTLTVEGVTVAGRPWEAGRLGEAPDRGGRRTAGTLTTHYTP